MLIGFNLLKYTNYYTGETMGELSMAVVDTRATGPRTACTPRAVHLPSTRTADPTRVHRVCPRLLDYVDDDKAWATATPSAPPPRRASFLGGDADRAHRVWQQDGAVKYDEFSKVLACDNILCLPPPRDPAADFEQAKIHGNRYDD